MHSVNFYCQEPRGDGARKKKKSKNQKSNKKIHILVRTVDVVNGQDSKVPVISEVAQGNARTGLEAVVVDGVLRDIEGDGHGEEVSIGQAFIFANTVDDKQSVLLFIPVLGRIRNIPSPVLFVHETCLAGNEG